jgi:hypothetical protein
MFVTILFSSFLFRDLRNTASKTRALYLITDEGHIITLVMTPKKQVVECNYKFKERRPACW